MQAAVLPDQRTTGHRDDLAARKRPCQYILRTRQDVPQLNVDNPKYKLAISAWRKLPLPVTQFVGPSIAKSIP